MARKSRKENNIILENTKPIYKTGLYLRLSDEDRKALEDNSIGNQRKICMEYMENHEDMLLIATYIDNGFTGTNFSRKGFIQMMRDIESERINCIIVKDLSRLGREYIGAGELIERIFPKHHVRFIAVNNYYDSETAGSLNQGMSVPITNIANDFYSKDTSKKIRDSIQSKIQDGSFMPSSGSVPYGYIRGEEKYLVDLEVKDIIVRIYELRSQGTAFNAIARSLNEDNLLSPGRLRYVRGMTKDSRCENSVWDRKAIQHILNNETYLGHRIHGKLKREKLGMPKKKRDSSEWQYIYNAHEAIITQELYDKVQLINADVLQKREYYRSGGELKEDYRNALLGKLVCGDCGSKMSGGRRNQRKNSKLPPAIHYQCGDYVQYRGRTVCFNHYITEAVIISQIEHILNIRLSMVPEMEDMLHLVKKASKSKATQQTYKKKKQDCEAKKERLWQDYSDGLLNKEEYQYAKQKYDHLYQELSNQEELYIIQAATTDAVMTETEQWMFYMKKYQKIKRLDDQMIDIFVKEIKIYGDKRMEIILNYNDSLLESVYNSGVKEELYAG